VANPAAIPQHAKRLPYDTVRGAAEPDALLLDFLSTTYVAAAEAAAIAEHQ